MFLLINLSVVRRVSSKPQFENIQQLFHSHKANGKEYQDKPERMIKGLKSIIERLLANPDLFDSMTQKSLVRRFSVNPHIGI